MFRLRWENSASRKLLNAAASSDIQKRHELLSALSRVETLLANDADTAGESREPGIRFLFAFPIGVTFQVNVRTQEVLVKRVTIRGGV